MGSTKDLTDDGDEFNCCCEDEGECFGICAEIGEIAKEADHLLDFFQKTFTLLLNTGMKSHQFIFNINL